MSDIFAHAALWRGLALNHTLRSIWLGKKGFRRWLMRSVSHRVISATRVVTAVR